MVDRRTLLILLGLALFATGLAAFAWMRAQPPAPQVAAGEPLLPQLEEAAQHVARIEIMRGNDRLVVRREGDGWVVGEAAYPVRAAEVRKLLLGLSQMRKVRPMTARPENWRHLFVDDPNPDSLATRIVLKDAKGKVIADVIAGREEIDRLGSGTEAQFMRLAEERRSWLVEGAVRVPVLLAQWVDTELYKLPAEKITRIEIVHEDGERLVLVREDQEEKDAPPMKVLDVPTSAKVVAGKVRALLNTAAEVSFTDVRKRRQEPKALARVQLETADGLKLALEVVRGGRVWWLRPRVLAEGRDKALAQRLRQRFAGREFAVYDSVGERLSSRLDGVIEAEVEDITKQDGQDTSRQGVENRDEESRQ